MANKNLTDLTADGTLADTDLMWKDTAGSAASHQITGAQLKASVAPEGTAVKSTGEAGGTKFLREDGDGTSSWQEVVTGWNVEDTANGNYGHGLNALDSLTVGVGQNNLAIGTNAGTALTSGSRNTYLGIGAGAGSATSSDNVAVGVNALLATGGNRNTVVGAYAGDALTTGSDNVIIGHDAGQGLTTGKYNTLVGEGAGSSVLAGDDYNVCVGRDANTSGLYGTAIGARSDAGSGDSVAVGYQADAPSGTVAVGSNAGSGNGVYCVSIGGGAGSGSTSGTGCILIGYNAQKSGATLPDQLVINQGASVPVVTGYMGARSDVDHSGFSLTITGPSAYASAAVNQDGGDLVLRGGLKATAGGTGGNVLLADASDPTKFASWDLSAITTATTRTITMPDADVDLSLVGAPATWNVEDTTNGNYGHGLRALDGLTGGSADNIAIGEDAGTAISTGTQNIAIGRGALQACSTSVRNVCIGDGAGDLISTTQSFNVCIGYDAGNAISSTGGGSNSGSYNVCIGYDADVGGGSDGYAVAIGSSAIGDADSVAIGRNARIVGTEAVCIGLQAGYSTSNAGNSTFVGGYSGYAVTSGNNNTLLGHRAGDTLTTGDYCVVIGSAVDVLSTTLDDQLVIGNGAVNPISGYMGARSDVDYSGKTLTITGPSAYASAVTNVNGGTLEIRGGQAASGGVKGKVKISDVLNVADVYTVAALPTGAVGDVCRISDGDAALAWGATAVNSGAGATPYLVWYNGTNWTILGS